MYWTERHLFMCTGSHCNQKGAANVLNKLRFELLRNKLSDRVHMNTCGTIDLCDVGPNLVVYPDNIVLSGLQESDIPAVLTFLRGGELPHHLVTSATAPAEEQRRTFFVWLRGQDGGATRESAHVAASDAGQTPGWLDEQLRRGFLAAKPNAQGDERITPTSKALHRYRID